MRHVLSARWRHEHRRAIRLVTGAGTSLAVLAMLGTAAAASGLAGGFGDARVGTSNANGILLASNQRVKPIGTRLLVNNARLVSSAVSPNGQYLAALSWNDFTGFLTIINLKTDQVIQQVGTGSSTDPVIGDGSVAADGPLWSPDGTTLWVPQSADLLRFSVSSTGMVSPSPVTITLAQNSPTEADLPSGMALSSDGSKLYVALNGVNELGVIDTSTNALVQLIHIGNAPRQVVLAGSTAFVSDEGGRPARPGEYTNLSDGTPIVANKVTGAATTGTVSVVNLVSGKVKEVPVGLEPTAEYLAADGTLIVANSNDDTLSFINTKTASVEQTVNVNPLPGSTVGSYPNAITMPDASHILVSIGRDNALAVYGYSGPTTPVKYLGLLPTDQYPVAVAWDAALGQVIVTNDKGIGSRGPQSTINKGPGTAPAPSAVTGYNTYDDTGSVTQFAMPAMSALAGYTHQVFVDNDWEHLLASTPLSHCTAAPVAIPVRLGCKSPIKHVFLIVRENRTFDQDFGDIGKGNSDASLAQFGATITPNGHALASQFGLFDNFYDEGTLSADGHNWLVQADANDYIEKEFGAFYRSYPASGADALAYQRDGFLWNAAEAAGQTVKSYGEYNNFLTQLNPVPSWSQYYQDSQIMEGQASGPLPVPPSSVNSYSDIPSLNAITDHQYPIFDLGIPDQYRVDMWQQSFAQSVKTGKLANLNLMWLPDDHTAGVGSGDPYPVAEVADNDLALGRIIDTISHSKFWNSSAVFVVEDDTQNGADHVDGHRGPLLVASPYAKRGIVDSTYYTQLNVVRTIEQILGVAPMNQEDRAAEPMSNAFTNTPDFTPFTHVANQIPLTYGLAANKAKGGATTWVPASPAKVGIPRSEWATYFAWVAWSRQGRFNGSHAINDWANPAQLNRLDWYSAHAWRQPYPGDKKILTPGEVPGHNLPAGYLGD
ncbi:MAG TPA: bifunctional YncE family protein/alkaline phosphatase family protein [Streptosporangiaceae bacterium]|nr:bifunctional YncE family protein/alkaline phosphatase family protein [Streptosporangiaceae bacterium]